MSWGNLSPGHAMNMKLRGTPSRDETWATTSGQKVPWTRTRSMTTLGKQRSMTRRFSAMALIIGSLRSSYTYTTFRRPRQRPRQRQRQRATHSNEHQHQAERSQRRRDADKEGQGRAGYLEPLGELVALDVADSLVEDLQVVVLGEEDDLLRANLVHGHLRDAGEAVLEVDGALRDEVEEVLHEADALEHDDRDAGHEPEVDDEVDQVARREDDVADERDEHGGERREVGRPRRAHRPPDAPTLVLEHHVPDREQRHHAQERQRVDVGQRAHAPAERDVEHRAQQEEGDRDEVVGAPETVLGQEDLRQAAVECEPADQTRDADEGCEHRAREHERGVSADPEAEVLAARVVGGLGEHVAVVRLDGGEVEDAHADEGEERVEDEDECPRVEERLREDPTLLLLNVVGRRLEAGHAEHGGAEAKEQRERPVVLERHP
eukprot:1761686-Rhodomonas_salina.4